MAEMTPHTNFVIKLTEKECAIFLKSLALMAGLDMVHPPTDEERELATELNRRLLHHQRTIYRERLRQTEQKLSVSGEPEVTDSTADLLGRARKRT